MLATTSFKDAKKVDAPFDGWYLCAIIETEECGAQHKRFKVIYNEFNVWQIKDNVELIGFIHLQEINFPEFKK